MTGGNTYLCLVDDLSGNDTLLNSYGIEKRILMLTLA